MGEPTFPKLASFSKTGLIKKLWGLLSDVTELKPRLLQVPPPTCSLASKAEPSPFGSSGELGGDGVVSFD